jgi:flagellar biosynthetic protein FliR
VLPNLNFSELEILAFALIFLRVSTFTIIWPIFSVYSVPGPLKVLLALALTMTIFPLVSRAGLTPKGLSNDIAYLAGKEVLTGLCLGFMTRLFFFAISCAGNLVATSAGLANGSLFNPALGASTTTVEQFYGALATLLFLSMNGHHLFLEGLVQSFTFLPLSLDQAVDGIQIASPLGNMVGHFKDSGLILQAVVEAGIKMSAPVLVAIFVLNVMMGIISRAVPQVNVLMTSMPVNFMAALIVLILAIPALVFEMNHEIVSFTEILFKFMRAN